MKSLFNFDSPLMVMLTRIGDMIIINALTILLCVPVITAGAAITAAHKVMQDMVMDTEGSLCKTYLRSFKSNFKQATGVWLLQVLVTVSLVCDFLLVNSFTTGKLALVLNIFLVILVFIVYGVVCYMYPLIARYENTLKQHLRNAMILSITRLHITLGMVVLTFLPLLILALSVVVFVQTLVFWVIIGVVVVVYLENSMLRKVYMQIEEGR